MLKSGFHDENSIEKTKSLTKTTGGLKMFTTVLFTSIHKWIKQLNETFVQHTGVALSIYNKTKNKN